MTDIPPKWAMEKARGIVAKRCPTTSLSDLVIKGAFDNAEPDIRDIARALAAEREAATMAERERCAKIADDAAPVSQDMRSSEIADTCEDIAADIRAGETA